MNWVQQITTNKAHIVDYRTTLPDGRIAFYFVDVDPIKINALREAIASGKIFRIDQFGRVLVSGFGEPRDELINAIKDEYSN